MRRTTGIRKRGWKLSALRRTPVPLACTRPYYYNSGYYCNSDYHYSNSCSHNSYYYNSYYYNSYQQAHHGSTAQLANATADSRFGADVKRTFVCSFKFLQHKC